MNNLAEETPAVPEATPVVPEETPAGAEETPAVAETTEIPEAAEESAPSEYVLSEPATVYEEEPAVVVQDDAVESSVDLVPADPNPPVVTEESALEGPSIVVVPEVPAAGVAVDRTVLAEPAAEKPATEQPAIAERPRETAKTERVTASLDGLPLVSSLDRGAYYVQIATYKDAANAWKVVNDHSKKYPIAIERSGSDSLKVCVGPVKKDECGAVLERFRGFGFKDAFVRKGK